jgi:hypothetical protein
VFSIGVAPRLYTEDLRHLTGELRGSLETVVEERRTCNESVEFRDASLPGYELGSRGSVRFIECSSVELKVWL